MKLPIGYDNFGAVMEQKLDFVDKSLFILELKSITPPKVPKNKLSNALEKLLIKESKSALKQINQKQYIAEMTQRGFKKIVKIGLAFAGKEFKIASE